MTMVDINCYFARETEYAYGIKVEEDTFGKDAKIHWIPKSMSEKVDEHTISMPEWKAIEEGLV